MMDARGLDTSRFRLACPHNKHDATQDNCAPTHLLRDATSIDKVNQRQNYDETIALAFSMSVGRNLTVTLSSSVFAQT
jgi:hypothetical protein